MALRWRPRRRRVQCLRGKNKTNARLLDGLQSMLDATACVDEPGHTIEINLGGDSLIAVLTAMMTPRHGLSMQHDAARPRSRAWSCAQRAAEAVGRVRARHRRCVSYRADVCPLRCARTASELRYPRTPIGGGKSLGGSGGARTRKGRG